MKRAGKADHPRRAFNRAQQHLFAVGNGKPSVLDLQSEEFERETLQFLRRLYPRKLTPLLLVFDDEALDLSIQIIRCHDTSNAPAYPPHRSRAWDVEFGKQLRVP